MSTPDATPQRVRVTSPRTGGAGRRRVPSVRSEINDQTQLGEVYMRSLMRTQLRLAFLVIGVLAATVGLLPVLFLLAPESRTTTVVGVPLPWLLLGLVVYPFMVLLGWLYVRRAEHNEQSFSDLVERR
jgi:hypothetical protein